MCGIAGLFDLTGARPVDQRLLARMTDVQAHRGPDGRGLYTAPGVGLGHRRLAIIDIAAGAQPMASPDGRAVICYNGEVYNFRALRDELEAAGRRFATHSDTEVILAAYERWGEACVERLRGMFAFAIWDADARRLFLARDRLGIKPLYWAELPGGWVGFASELKGLTVHPGLDRGIDPLAVEEYFGYGYVAEPRTIYRSVHKLEPGHTLTLERGRGLAAPRRYWDVPFAPVAVGGEAEAREGLVERLREAVRLRLVAEVPLGAFLSGGVDSSAVVAMMAGLDDKPVNTCSIRFDVEEFDESAYAAMVAERYRTAHRTREVAADDFPLIDRLASLYDEPYADSSALPTYRVCELAREQVTVALSGDGGDENLAGYRRYRLHLMEERARRLLPLGLRRAVFGPLGRWYPKLDWAPRIFRGKTTFEALARDSVAAWFHTVSLFSDGLRERLFTPAFRRALGGYRAVDVLRRHAAAAPTDHPLSLVQYLDMKTYLVGDILTKVDRASMAHSLEVRVPLLDHELVEWISGLPPELKLRGGEGKYLLKRAMEPHLPREVLYRQKMGFAVPLARWFRGPLAARVREAVLGPRLAATGWFEPRFLEHLVRAHQSGARDYSTPLWTLLMFDAFLAREAGDAGTRLVSAA